MFATRYFPNRYFAPRYFPKVGAVPPTPPDTDTGASAFAAASMRQDYFPRSGSTVVSSYFEFRAIVLSFAPRGRPAGA